MASIKAFYKWQNIRYLIIIVPIIFVMAINVGIRRIENTESLLGDFFNIGMVSILIYLLLFTFRLIWGFITSIPYKIELIEDRLTCFFLFERKLTLNLYDLISISERQKFFDDEFFPIAMNFKDNRAIFLSKHINDYNTLIQKITSTQSGITIDIYLLDNIPYKNNVIIPVFRYKMINGKIINLIQLSFFSSLFLVLLILLINTFPSAAIFLFGIVAYFEYRIILKFFTNICISPYELKIENNTIITKKHFRKNLNNNINEIREITVLKYLREIVKIEFTDKKNIYLEKNLQGYKTFINMIKKINKKCKIDSEVSADEGI